MVYLSGYIVRGISLLSLNDGVTYVRKLWSVCGGGGFIMYSLTASVGCHTRQVWVTTGWGSCIQQSKPCMDKLFGLKFLAARVTCRLISMVQHILCLSLKNMHKSSLYSVCISLMNSSGMYGFWMAWSFSTYPTLPIKETRNTISYFLAVHLGIP